MTQATAPKTLTVTITLESNPSLDGQKKGQYWVAHTEDGTWHSYCEKHFASHPGSAAAMIYHASEIHREKSDDSKATVELFTC